MDTSKQPWQILHIDDDEDDHVLVKAMLREAKGRKVALDWASTIEAGRKKLRAGIYQAVLVDYDMGAASGIDLIRECTANGVETPLILLTGRGNYEVDMEAMHAGASLYLTKGEINPLLLERSIRYAIERKQGEAQLRLSEEKFSIIFDRSPTPTFLLSYPQARFVDVNQAYLDLTGYAKEEVVGKTSEELGISSQHEETRQILDTLEAYGRIQDVEIYVYTKNGQRCITSANMEVVVIEDEKMILGTAKDLTARKLVEAQLIESNEALRKANAHAEWVARFPEENPNPVLRVAVNGTLLYLNRSAIQLAYFANVGERISDEILAIVTESVIKESTLLREIDLAGKHYTVQVAPFPDESYANLYFIDSTERHQAEQQTAFHASLMENMHDALIATDTGNRITAWNKASELLYGITAHEALGKNVSLLLRSEFDDQQRSDALRQLEESGYYTQEVVQYTKDGRRLVVEGRVMPWRDSQGQICGYMAVNRDITLRRMAEDALRASEQRWATTLSSIGDAVIATDTDGKITFMNPVAEELTGWSMAEAAGSEITQVFNIITESTRQPMGNPVDKVLEQGRTAGLANHTLLVRKEGMEIPIDDSGAPIQDEAGNMLGVVLVFRNVSERRQAEQAIRQQNEALEAARIETENEKLRLEAVMEALPVGLAITDDMGGSVQANPAYEQVWGGPLRPVESVDDYTAYQAWWADSGQPLQPEEWASAQAVLKGKAVVGQFLKIQRFDGRHAYVINSASPVLDANGRIIGSAVAIQDISRITETEMLDKALNQINRVLHSTLDFEQVMQHAISASSTALGSETAAISLCQNDRWVVRYVHGFPDEILGVEMDNDQERHAILAIQSRLPVAVNDAFQDERVNREHMREWGVRSVLVVPIILREEAIGVMFFNFQTTNFDFQEHHIQFAVNLADSISLALDNARLFGSLEQEIQQRRHIEEELRKSSAALQERNEALLASEQTFRELVETLNVERGKLAAAIDRLPVGIGIQDAWGNTLSLNDAGLKIHGFHSKEEMFDRLDQYIHEFELSYPDGKYMPPEEWPVARALRGEFVQDYELRLRNMRSDQECYLSYSVAPVLNSEGDLSLIVYVIQDLSERKLAEEQTRFQAMLLSRVHDAVVAIDEKMRVTYFNKAAEELFGWTLDEVQGKASEDLFGTNILGRTNEQVTKVFPESGFYEGEVSYCRKDGSSFDAHVRSVVIHGSGEQVKGLVTSVRDITERKQAQDTLSRYAHQLEQSNKELENFALVASHDLREPLRKIETFGNLIAQRAGPALGKTEREYLERMQNAAERMRVMIEDLLSLSRVTSAGKPFEMVDLNQVALTVLEDLEGSIQEVGGRVELGELPALLADPTQMHQLLQNLVGNALKFCKPGKPPVVRVFSRNLLDGRVEISVADNGIGIDMGQAERLFQPFQRLHGRAEYGGTGIGLSVCRKIVERHGGEIRVKSQVGHGACFTVCLPGWS